MAARKVTACVAVTALLALLCTANASGGPSSSGGGGGGGGPPPGGPSGSSSCTLGTPLDHGPGAVYQCDPNISKWSTCTDLEYLAIRDEIIKILPNPKWDNGNTGPAFIRLAWHNCGTYKANPAPLPSDPSKLEPVGGCSGGHMRFRDADAAAAGFDPTKLEIHHGANAGLDKVQDLLKGILEKYTCITHPDLWTLAATTVFNKLSGGKVNAQWCPGRCDSGNVADGPENGRLPAPDYHKELPLCSGESQHLRDVFYRMGYNDQEIVLLSQMGHRMGRAHVDRSGLDGQWDHNAVQYDNAYLKNLLGNQWQLTLSNYTKTGLQGKPVHLQAYQYENTGGRNLMMFATDFCLKVDPTFACFANAYANNQDAIYKHTGLVATRLFGQGVDWVTSRQQIAAGGGSNSCFAP